MPIRHHLPFGAYEFFAGGGLAGLGLDGFRTLLANDLDTAKAASWRANHALDIHVGDVWDLSVADLPGRADLAWASSPCQDVSLAGARAGLAAQRSGAFWGFWRLIEGLDANGRAPPVIVIENVREFLTWAPLNEKNKIDKKKTSMNDVKEEMIEIEVIGNNEEKKKRKI